MFSLFKQLGIPSGLLPPIPKIKKKEFIYVNENKGIQERNT
jgi:hypothetical protein